jgi:hypothetical protein
MGNEQLLSTDLKRRGMWVLGGPLFILYNRFTFLFAWLLSMQLWLDLSLLVWSLLFCMLLVWDNSLQYQVEESFRDVMKRIFRFSNEISFAMVILKLS